jgi:hypothetical protein
MLEVAATPVQLPIETIGSKLSFTTIFALLATIPAMASSSLAGSESTVSALPKSHNLQPGATLTGIAGYYPSVLSGHKTASG